MTHSLLNEALTHGIRHGGDEIPAPERSYLIIDSSKIGMESARKYYSVNVRAAGFTARSGRGINEDLFGNFLSAGSDDGTGDSKKTTKKNAAQTKNPIENQWKTMTNTGRISAARMRSDANAMSRLRQHCIMHILDILCSFRHGRQGFESGSDPMEQSFFDFAEPMPLQPVSQLQFSRQEFSYESEETAFSSTGRVVTSDGRTIDFNMDIYMSREFASYYEETAAIQTALLDPLVINLDVDTASVTDQKFYFDLDADGEKELISGLGSGSGYLALDKNGNGVIDDGSELFGTASGDGFLDLSKYDEDHNGWIDENDSIFEKLKIWTKDENGKDVLYSLKDKGVGALALTRIPTEHSLTSPLDNTVNAVIRSTGLFLYENGSVGSMQQVDLASFSKTG